MPNHVSFPVPLTRLNPWYPGQFGVPGTDARTGLRLNTQGAIFWVDPNHVDPNDNRDGTNPDAPLQTVAAALAKCVPYRGDTIAVMHNGAWQYGSGVTGYDTAIQEEVTITVPGIRLVGVAQGAVGVPWVPVTAGGAGTCITVYAMDVTIEGFAFQGGALGGRAIYAEWDSPTLFGENLTVRYCLFDGHMDVGIQLEYAWFCEIGWCYFQECAADGLMTDVGGSSCAYTYIHDSLFMDCNRAMSLLGGASWNSIARNMIYNSNAQGGGAATDEGIDTTGGAMNMVFDNWFSCVLPAMAAGDWDDLNTGAASDAWVGNHCTNGLAVTTPA